MKRTSILLFICLSIAYQSFGQSKTQNVFLITFDGLRWQEVYNGADPIILRGKKYVKNIKSLKDQFYSEDPSIRREKLMPFFWEKIIKKGQLYGNRAYGNKVNVTNDYWFSYPGYNEILTGSSDDKRINSNDKVWNPNKTVFEFINNQPDFRGKVAVFASWEVFSYIYNEKRSGIPVFAGFKPVTGSDLTPKGSF